MMQPDPSPMATALRHDRLLLVAGLLLVAAASWLYLLGGAGLTGDPMTSMEPQVWGPGYATMMFIMWTLMMVAMMLPSATPMILLYAAVTRSRAGPGRPALAAVLFALAYVTVWAAFSATAVALQFGLARAALLSPMLQISSTLLAGALLIGAGIYQWTPLKQSCLHRCRSPLEFMLAHWRPGASGAFVLGLRHGVYCLGCCWVLMLLLFVGGVMNLAWVASLALFVLVEKLVPGGHWLGHAVGVGLIAWGTAVLLASELPLTAG
jgi:predicted metal-binding membrane protein